MLYARCSTKEAIWYHCFFLGARRISKKERFLQHFWGIVANQNKKTRIKTLYILKLLYTGCSTKKAMSLLLLRSTENVKNKWLLQKHFGWVVVNQNRKNRIKRLYILKLLYTGCSTKEVISLASFEEHLTFQEKMTLTEAF